MDNINKMDKKNWNPNPIIKLIVLLLFSFTIKDIKSEWTMLGIVIIFSVLYFLMRRYRDGFKNIGVFLILFLISNYGDMKDTSRILYMFITVIFVIKMFYLPFMAGAFLIKTTDVGSIVSCMDKLHISKNLSIPIATMFRFGPSFKEEYKNIRFAMKMRGISIKKPLLALEYIYVPLLTISSEIAEDIAKYAETKALSDPCKKVRLTKISFGLIDLLFIISIVIILVVEKI